MSDLFSSSPEALVWFNSVKAQHCERDSPFGRFVPGIFWVDEPGPDGEPIGGADPTPLVDEINDVGWPLLDNHDPGRPLGRVLAARVFTSPGGVKFAVQLTGLYDEASRRSFDEAGLNARVEARPPLVIDTTPGEWWIEVLHDPREYDDAWIEDATSELPLPLKRHHASHNAAEAVVELLRVGLPYLVLTWNPLTTTIAKEAGKDIYEGVRDWLRALLVRVQDRKNPVVSVQTSIDGCSLLFLFRGRDPATLRVAHDDLARAALQAGALVDAAKKRGLRPETLAYEYAVETGWFPSYAVLEDGRLISDANILVALEQSRSELSVGIKVLRGKDKPPAPRK